MSTPLEEPSLGLPPPPPAPTLPPRPPRPEKSPLLALVLSMFPGLGQFYNGQVEKAFAFFAAWVAAIYFTAEVDPLPFAFFIPAVYLMNLVDAFRTAVAINERRVPSQTPREVVSSPAVGVSLIVFGAVVLLNNLGWLRLYALRRFWPVLFIVAGAFLLYRAVRGRSPEPAPASLSDDRLV